MHILLTDVLACPRCGPEFGLILLADTLSERVVTGGSLGCANCRAMYPIRSGVVSFADGSRPAAAGAGQREAPGTLESADPPEEHAVRTAALLGVQKGGGALLLLDLPLAVAAGVASLLPETRVVLGRSAGGDDGIPGDDPDLLDVLLLDGSAPFRTRSLRGVAVGGEASPELVVELARTLLPGARIVLERGGEAGAALLREAGLQVLLVQDGVAVASAPGAP